jgi:hypothetical protein
MKFSEKLLEKIKLSDFAELYKATCVRYYNAGHFLYLRQVRQQDSLLEKRCTQQAAL